MTKAIIQRNLDLSVSYTLIDKKYIPLLDGIGLCCDNCGKLIANIATVKSPNGTHNIGFDCLETVLINNKLLEGKGIVEYERYKAHLPLYIKRAKEIAETITEHNNTKVNKITALLFDVTQFQDWYQNDERMCYLTFYYQFDNAKPYNDNLKIRGTSDLKDFLKVVETICKVPVNTR